MARLFWTPAVAFGFAMHLAVPVIAQVAPEQPKQNETASQRKNGDGEKQSVPFSIPVRVLEVPEEVEMSERYRQEASQREEEDLLAQKSMAGSTQEIVLWTKVQVILAALGTLALIVTILLNRTATLAAISASKAADESNKLAKSQVALQNRPWIVSLGWQIRGNGEQGAVEAYGFDFQWRNFGITPAINLVMITAPADSDTDFPNGEPNFTASAKRAGEQVIGPQSNFSSPAVWFTPEQIFASAQTPIRIRGAVKYDTLFDELIGRRTDVAIDIRYVGRAGLDQIKAGNISTHNFEATAVGAISKMT